MTRRRAIFCGVLLGMVTLIAAVMYQRREPRYLGHPISYWIEPWHRHGPESPEREAAAYAEMDARAVRWLARQLEWKPSRLKEGFARFMNSLVGDFMPDRDYDNGRRNAAVRALIRLGPRAKAAVPELEALSRTDVELHRNDLRNAATNALVRIRADSLQPYIEQLKTASGADWGRLATLLGVQETNAAEAAPILAAGLLQTNQPIQVPPTVAALGSIHSYPEVSVPALMQQLGRTNRVTEYQVFVALAQFGPDARSCWPELAGRVTATTNLTDRQALLYALRHIDPDRFASANWR